MKTKTSFEEKSNYLKMILDRNLSYESTFRLLFIHMVGTMKILSTLPCFIDIQSKSSKSFTFFQVIHYESHRTIHGSFHYYFNVYLIFSLAHTVTHLTDKKTDILKSEQLANEG